MKTFEAQNTKRFILQAGCCFQIFRKSKISKEKNYKCIYKGQNSVFHNAFNQMTYMETVKGILNNCELQNKKEKLKLAAQELYLFIIEQMETNDYCS